MAECFDLQRVQVLCTCNRSCPLSQIYFCRHCYEPRCGNCVSHEVDSHFCPNCLENMTSAEAKMRKNRCGNCFDCPCCGHTLSTRGTFAIAPSTVSTPTSGAPQKTYYLLCGFCQWSTRDSGISDTKAPSGGWQETPNRHAERIEALVNAYRQLAMKEKNERDKNKYARKRNYTMLMERYPVLTPRFRRCRTSAWNVLGRESEPMQEIEIPAVEAQPISDSFCVDALVNEHLYYELVTSPEQRHRAPGEQPTCVAQLQPHHKALAVKRSLRCRRCEHTLSKADFNPGTIKFRINLSAVYHVPDLRFSLELPSPLPPPKGQDVTAVRQCVTPRILPTVTFDSLPPRQLPLKLPVPGSSDTPIQLVLSVSNPAHRVTTVRLRQLSAEEEATRLAEYFKKAAPHLASASSTINTYSTLQLNLPSYGIKIGAKNDTLDLNELGPMEPSKEFLEDDDATVIAFRHNNVVGINATASFSSPEAKLEPGEPLRAALEVNFDYCNAAGTITSSFLLSASSESRAAAVSAVLSASGIPDDGDKKAVPRAPQPMEELRDVNMLFLLDFGSWCH